MINNYDDFVTELLRAGFSVASGGNDEGVFGLIKHGWNEKVLGCPVRWHTGDPETDPWEWRMRVLNERNDIAYGKIFFRKGGFITKEWYPYFLAARRGKVTFAEEYEDGKMSHFAKRIYDTAAAHERLPLHEIKRLGGFRREDKSKFDRALTELQMRMYLTICGQRQRISHNGKGYSWSSTELCPVDTFWGKDILAEAANISAAEAARKITEQVFRLNPAAQEKKVMRFITG